MASSSLRMVKLAITGFPQENRRKTVGWVERSETHQNLARGPRDGFRCALPILLASNAIIAVIAMQSKLLDRDQDADEGRSNDPERDGAPSALLSLAAPHGGDRFRRQLHAVPRQELEPFQQRDRAACDGR